MDWEKKAIRYRYFRNWFLALCIFWAALCVYAIIQWQQEEAARIEIEELYNLAEQDKNHYLQQWVDMIVERNQYYDLYEDCQNQEMIVQGNND